MSNYKDGSGNSSLRPIHLAIVLAIVLHFTALAALAWYSPKKDSSEDSLRIVAQVSLADSIKLPEAVRKSVKAPPVKPKKIKPYDPELYRNVPKTSMDKYGVAPGKIGRPGKPGAPGDPAKKVGKGAGRSGLRTAIDPDMPKLGVSAMGNPGYPTGHGYGKDGSKFGKHSGFGEDGGGQGGEGGDGGEGGQGGVIVKDLIYVIEADQTISVYEKQVDPAHYISDKARITNEIGQFVCVYLASKFNVTVINNSDERLNFRFEGELHRGESYNGLNRILDPYLWGDLAPGESRCINDLTVASGYRDVSISHLEDPVGTFFNIEHMLFIPQ